MTIFKRECLLASGERVSEGHPLFQDHPSLFGALESMVIERIKNNTIIVTLIYDATAGIVYTNLPDGTTLSYSSHK